MDDTKCEMRSYGDTIIINNKQGSITFPNTVIIPH